MSVSPVGLADVAKFPAGLFTASSAALPASDARLQGASAWNAATVDANQWIQVDLKTPYLINAVSVQGGGAAVAGWVTTYKFAYSEDNVQYATSDKVYTANVDATSVNVEVVAPPVKARYIRLLPQAWSAAIAMRIELSYALFGDPWHAFEISEARRKKLIDLLKNHKPSLETEKGRIPLYFNVGILGQVGAGKSSTFNQYATAITQDREFNLAEAGQGTSSLTKELNKYDINPKSPISMPVKLWDMPGYQVNEELVSTYSDISGVLAGNWKNRTVIAPGMRGEDSRYQTFFEPNPTIFDRIHCLVLVVDAEFFDSTPASASKYKTIYMMARAREIGCVVLLTKIDKLFTGPPAAALQKDPASVYRFDQVKELIKRVSDVIGVNNTDVVPLINATTYGDANRDLAHDCMILAAIEKTMGVCNRYYYKSEHKAEALAAAQSMNLLSHAGSNSN